MQPPPRPRVAQNVQTSFADSAKLDPGTLGPEVSKNTFFVNFEACPDMPVELWSFGRESLSKWLTKQKGPIKAQ